MEKMVELYVVYNRGGIERYSDIVSVPSYIVDSSMTQTLKTYIFNELTKHGLIAEQIIRIEKVRGSA